MEDDNPTPPTQPFGDLVPPPKLPPTALALASPAPLPHRRPSSPELYDASALQRLISRTFDLVDTIADTVAEGLGLRGR
jgi:hypothetical protein